MMETNDCPTTENTAELDIRRNLLYKWKELINVQYCFCAFRRCSVTFEGMLRNSIAY